MTGILRPPKGAPLVRDDAHVRRTLRQLAGVNPKGQQREARWVHPFAARMPLSVAEHFVRGLSQPNAVVLDPMVGSGTTAVATRQLGRRAVGIERDPLALLISRVATPTYSLERILEVSERVLKRARLLLADKGAPVTTTGEMDRFIEYWFPIEAQQQLAALARSIRDETPGAGSLGGRWHQAIDPYAFCEIRS